MSARVSVIILSHNAADYVGEAIESALEQTHRPHEVLVIDDSTDASPDVVADYERQSAGTVRLHRVEPCNVSVARNIALDRVTGDAIAFLDADDAWLADKTARQLAALRADAEAVGAFCPYFDFRREYDDCDRTVPKPGIDNPTLRDVLMMQNISSSTFLAWREAIGDLRFDENAPDGEDTIFVAELRLRGRFRKVDEPLIAKRVHGGQASGTAEHRVRNARTRLEWVHRRRDAIGVADADALEAELASGLMRYLEHLYWSRDIGTLRRIVDEAAEAAPQAWTKSMLSRTRLYPRWVYRLRDALGRKPA